MPRPLPERYRFLFIEDKREVELVWKRWTGAYIFANEWQSFRTRRDLDLVSSPHTYPIPAATSSP